MNTIDQVYRFEDIRDFYIRRKWLAINPAAKYPCPRFHHRRFLLTEDEYAAIKARSLLITSNRAAMIRAFIEGWYARGG